MGIVVHGDSFIAGHGPGIATFLSCKSERLEPVLDAESNIAKYHNMAYGPLKPL